MVYAINYEGRKLSYTDIFFAATIIHADELTSPTLNDVSYQFDHDKLKAANDSFHFLRTFVDYYYDLFPANLKPNIASNPVVYIHPEEPVYQVQPPRPI